MAENKKRRAVTGIGVSSLIIIFVVLAVSIFSLLTLLTVRQDLKSAELSVKAQEAYYAADTIVTEKLAVLNSLLSDEEITDTAAAADEAGFESEITGRGEVTFSLKQKIDDSGDILVKAVYSGGTLTVTRYSVISSQYYVNNDSLPVWDGETLPIEREE